MDQSVIVGNIVGGVGLIVAGYFAVRPTTIPATLDKNDALRSVLSKLSRRRRRTAGVMAAVTLLFLVGINFFRNPSVEKGTALPALLLWTVLLALIVVLVILALMDVRTVVRMRRELQRRVSHQLRENFEDHENI